MKNCRWLIALFVALACSSVGFSQISNLVVNGSSTSFTMTSGDVISWSYDIPTGGTAACDIWYDVNSNGTIDPAIDKEYITFAQTDGDMSGHGGPPDLDGTANGHVSFSQAVGLAPGHFIMRFTNNGSSQSVTGTINPLASPAHTISGHVTPPSGKSAQYIFLTLQASNGGGGSFWDGVTDASGNYSIGMNSDTSGGPWRLRLEVNPYPPASVTPEETTVTIIGNPTGYDFTFVTAAAQVAGYVLHDDGSPYQGGGAYVMRNDTTNIFRRSSSDLTGFFQIGLLASDLTSTTWTLQAETNGNNNNITTTEMQARVGLPVIANGDSLFRILKVYSTNSTIRGTVLLNGTPPHGFQLQVSAESPDTAIALTNTDTANGTFSVNVSNKIHSYAMKLNWISYDWIVDPVTAHAGDSNVVINVRTSMWSFVTHRMGWNMLSLPLTLQDVHKDAVFGNATTPAYNYAAGSGYRTDSLLQYGKGYWLKFNDSSDTWMNGYQFYRETLNVLAGWNMIAVPSPGIPTAAIIAVGTTVTTPYYGYNGGYYTTASLGSGFGYWVKVNSAGQLIVNTTSIPPRSAHTPNATEPAPDGSKEDLKLSFTDAGGETRALYFSQGLPDHPSSWYDMPPMPPAGVMDVRYATQKLVVHPDVEAAARIPVLITSALYPVKISWKSLPTGTLASFYIDGKKVQIAGTGECIIASEHNVVELGLDKSAARELPAQFALHQNFPNPFNPTTEFTYDLASAANVRLTVFNTLGQEVATVVDEFQNAGSYHTAFAPANLPSGVYYYRLIAGNFTAMKKMLLIK